MSKKSKAIGEAGGMIARRVGKKLNFGDFADGAAQTIKKSTDEIVQKVKRVSKRRKYLGSTPGKASRTGREVIQRMKNAKPPQIVTKNGVDYLDWTDPATGVRRQVPLSECDMGHYPVDAVTYWNTEGYKHGPKSQAVRDWMLDPDNYMLQPSSYNRSQGAKLGQTYRDV